MAARGLGEMERVGALDAYRGTHTHGDFFNQIEGGSFCVRLDGCCGMGERLTPYRLYSCSNAYILEVEYEGFG